MFSHCFFKALNIDNEQSLKQFSKNTKISVRKLKYYNDTGIYPSKSDLQKILMHTNLSEVELQLKLGILNHDVLDAIRKHSETIHSIIKEDLNTTSNHEMNHTLKFETRLGKLYQGDCMSLMNELEDESIDLIFADPPFNLNKKYESEIDDNISKEEYLRWTEQWVRKCINLLKEGGSFFIWNLPKWNVHIAEILNKHLTFKHWIAVDIKYRLPIKNRLYPSHYGLLYYTKGERANVFHEQRVPLEICRHCGGDIRDYGGYKSKLNESGINVTDVWYDIPPVRHSKYKTRDSNELSMKLLERVISIASNEGDLVFDPFGGSGTTYVVSEILNRKWIGIEIGPIENIQNRFDHLELQKKYIQDIQQNKNKLFTDEMRKLRMKHNQWLPETLRKKTKEK